ncbi:hypothetical protein Tco_0557635, partial [Tanacetum coccineum]
AVAVAIAIPVTAVASKGTEVTVNAMVDGVCTEKVRVAAIAWRRWVERKAAVRTQ